jgi:hypothetical protein
VDFGLIFNPPHDQLPINYIATQKHSIKMKDELTHYQSMDHSG